MTKAPQGKRILIVDDERNVQTVLRLSLEGAGYAVDCADNGHEALERITRVRPDLVLLDIMMPVMDGWELLEHLKRIAEPPPVVVLSAFLEPRRAFQAGAAAYLSKPFRLQDLLSTCRQALEGASS